MKKAFLIALVTVAAMDAAALPFNTDMFRGQFTDGDTARPRVAGTVPQNRPTGQIASRQVAETTSNPIKADEFSVARGQRLYRTNCTPCHGQPTTDPAKWEASRPLGQKMPGPNLADQMYRQVTTPSTQGRTDGQFYAQIHFGGAIMQRVGWKLSADETWDIINYIRAKQKE